MCVCGGGVGVGVHACVCVCVRACVCVWIENLLFIGDTDEVGPIGLNELIPSLETTCG